MIRFLAPALLLAAEGCTPHIRPEQTAIMDLVERQITLPRGAKPLTAYARAYAETSKDRVSALYFCPDAEFSSCRGAKAGGPSNGQIVLLCPPPEGMQAGERRWLDNSQSLPSVSDGGCAYVDVEFNIPAKKVVLAQCHGDG